MNHEPLEFFPCYIVDMKRSVFSFLLAAVMTLGAGFAFAQDASVNENIQSGFLNVHINQQTTRMDLAQLQKDMSQVGIAFRYDLIEWEADELKSIRMAVRLTDGSMRRAFYETIEEGTDIWIRLEGSGDNRVFCAGANCED